MLIWAIEVDKPVITPPAVRLLIVRCITTVVAVVVWRTRISVRRRRFDMLQRAVNSMSLWESWSNTNLCQRYAGNEDTIEIVITVKGMGFRTTMR